MIMIICSMEKQFQRFIGKKEFTEGEYVPSKFNYYFDIDGESLVYNSFSGVFALLSSDQLNNLHLEKCMLTNAVSDDISELVHYRLLVSSDIDETIDYLNLYRTVKGFIYNPAITSYTVLTTTGCNARCFYCFEQDFKAVTMKTITAEVLSDFMIQNSQGKPISIHWFGGEPLCNTNAIDTICSQLDKAGIVFSSTMTSNGYAFTKKIIENAASHWRLKSVQITLDGLREEHNRRKNYFASKPDPFNQTIMNIHDLLDAKIRVSLRLNFDSGNSNEMSLLIDYLSNEFSGCKGLSAYSIPLFEDCNAWNPDRDNEEQLNLIRRQQDLNDEIRSKFLLSEKNVCRGFSISHCGANNPAHRTVNPDGTFSFCHNYSDTYVYGSIFDGIKDKVAFEKWTNNDRLREMCKNCIWLPECTAFDMCPVKKTYCKIEYENQVRVKLSRIYRQWKLNSSKNN